MVEFHPAMNQSDKKQEKWERLVQINQEKNLYLWKLTMISQQVGVLHGDPSRSPQNRY